MDGRSKVSIRRSPQAKPTFAGLRRYNRRELITDVVLQDHDGWEVPVESIDISPTGIFVRSNFLFEVGQRHTLVFEVDGRGMFRLEARVARVEAADQDQPPGGELELPGMGYEFVETNERAWQDLCAVAAGV